LLKNYLSKLRAYYNKKSSLPDGTEFTLRVLSIRDKLSKLTQETNLKDTFYMEFKIVKQSDEHSTSLRLKEVDYSLIKGHIITLKD
jgi:hypothetical protein